MKNVKAWIEAIRAEVDDDTPRLAFADWLEERDQSERAEFIRVQCRLARIDGDDPRRPGLARREHELLEEHAADWKKEVPAWAAKYGRFQRGFVAHVGCGVKTFLKSAGGLRTRSPVTSAYLSKVDRAAFQALGESEHLACLQDITLAECEIGGIGHLLDSPHADRLSGLHFYLLSKFGPRLADLEPLLASPRLAQLTRLSLRYITCDELDVRRFAGLEGVRQLEQLRLQGYETPETAVRALASSPSFANLRSLGLELYTTLTDEGLQALADSPHLGQLRCLALNACSKVTDKGLKAIAASKRLRNLTDLDLTSLCVSAKGIQALIDSPNLPRLGRIDLLFDDDFERLPLWRWDEDLCTLWVREARA